MHYWRASSVINLLSRQQVSLQIQLVGYGVELDELERPSIQSWTLLKKHH
jgi:hypothetical protein